MAFSWRVHARESPTGSEPSGRNGGPTRSRPCGKYRRLCRFRVVFAHIQHLMGLLKPRFLVDAEAVQPEELHVEAEVQLCQRQERLLSHSRDLDAACCRMWPLLERCPRIIALPPMGYGGEVPVRGLTCHDFRSSAEFKRLHLCGLNTSSAMRAIL
jgi:hypothetical protein